MSREPRVYAPADRPDVEVLVDGEWCEGELRQWKPEGEEDWIAEVCWRRGPGQGNFIGDFAAGDVREDRGYGRHSSR